MKTRFIVVGAIAAALLAGTAMAQTPATATKPEAASAGVTQSYKGQWRAYKMIGLDVYNQNNEKLGDISELLTDLTGKIQTAILGVGGFPGVGERMVAVSFDQLKFVNQPIEFEDGVEHAVFGSFDHACDNDGRRDHRAAGP